MRYIFICNTSSDYISRVSIDPFKEDARIYLNKENCDRIGPHGICIYNNKLVVANNYSNSISLIDIKSGNVEEEYFIGMHCNAVSVCDDYAYVICGESNCLVIFDLLKSKVVEEIPCGNMPHSIDINDQGKKILISNMESSSLTIINKNDNGEIKNIKVGQYPTKAIFTKDRKYILVCESNLGEESKGNVTKISADDYSLVKRISVGSSPVDMYRSNDLCFVSNFSEGTISVIKISDFKELKRIKVGGMPRGVVKAGNYIYVGDNFNNMLIRIDLVCEKKQAIPIGNEPNGMTIYED